MTENGNSPINGGVTQTNMIMIPEETPGQTFDAETPAQKKSIVNEVIDDREKKDDN